MKPLSTMVFVGLLLAMAPSAATADGARPAAHRAKAVHHPAKVRRRAFHPPLKRPDVAGSVGGGNLAYAGSEFGMAPSMPTRLSAERILGAPVAGSLGFQRGETPILDAHEVNQAAAVQMERSNALVGAQVNLNF